MTAAPHDALFKATFSQVELAAEELRCVLPPELVARMDLGSLTLAAGSFVDATASELSRESEEIMETIAQYLRREGRQEGRQEGERAIVLRMLQRRFGELLEALRERVEAADSRQLERWSDRLFSAGSLDVVFADEPTQ